MGVAERHIAAAGDTVLPLTWGFCVFLFRLVLVLVHNVVVNVNGDL